MYNQKELWNKAHGEGDIAHHSKAATAFAEEVLLLLSTGSQVLELGCGVGNDSVAFANAGHIVTATDFSEVAVAADKGRYKDVSGLTFQELDMSQDFEFEDNQFDAIYARLSLHYFTDVTTRKIFKELERVLRPDGKLFFICKSTADPLYGKGVELQKDMYELDGHVRHFFSEEYARSLLNEGFVVDKIESGTEEFYGHESAFVKAFAHVVKR